MYGAAKLTGAQFTVLDSELSKPLGEVSGFWLTWYYFSYSPVYGTAVALAQIAAGVLLVLPRTALAGAVLLLPIAANIVLIDLCFGVDLSGTATAIVLLALAISIIAPAVPRLRSAILLETLPVRPSVRAIVTLSVLVVGAFAFTWWVANVNNRAPTSIDGVWAVTSSSASTPWRHIFFERNRAFLVVFRSPEGDESHHFEIDGDGRVRIWNVWLAKGALLMEGRVTSDTEIELNVADAKGGGRLVLTRTGAAR